MKATCICPGSYDPITNGHLDIIRRAAAIFDRVVVAVLDSAAKSYMFSRDERLEMVEGAVAGIGNARAVSHEGLLVDLMQREGITVIVRGVRTAADCDAEMQIAKANRFLMPQCETMFLPAGDEYACLSSTIVRELIRFRADISALVPRSVTELIQ